MALATHVEISYKTQPSLSSGTAQIFSNARRTLPAPCSHLQAEEGEEQDRKRSGRMRNYGGGRRRGRRQERGGGREEVG
jgi:hypothetical protein